MLEVEILDRFELADENDGVSFWKELIYVGSFNKKTDSEDLQFAVSERDIDNWVSIHKLFMLRGISVPLPKDHSLDVESSRGTVTEMLKKLDSRGRIALFGKIRFRDKKAAELVKTAKVSIYVPPTYTDSNSNTYSHPIRHVALTDYPVINELDNFIAASFNTDGEKVMPMKQLATALGVKFAEDDDDEKISAAIADEFSAMKKSIKAAEHDDDTTTTAEPSTTTAEPTPTVSASMRDILKENRNNKITALVTDGKITPAVAKGLEEQYCTPTTLTLSLSNDTYDDGFQRIMETLNKNDPVVLGEQTAGQSNRQVLKLGPNEVNPLHADAEKRAKAAKG